MLSTTRQAGKASAAMTLAEPLSTSTVTTLQNELSIGAERDPRIGVQKEPLGW